MKTKIQYVTGNVLEAPQPIIVHQVNCQGVMGSGVAKAIRDKYPEVYMRYNDYVLDHLDIEDFHSSRLLGRTFLTQGKDGKIIANVFGQDHFIPRGIRHTSYDALEKGLQQLKNDTDGDLAMPRIGCGLGGGDWHIVSAIIESVFDDRNIYVYDLE